MDNYVKLGTSTEELSRLVLNFKLQAKDVKDMVRLLGSEQDSRDLRDRITLKREQCVNMSRQLGQLFKAAPSDRSERWKHIKLAQDFESILREFEQTNSQALSKEQQFISIIRESLSSEEPSSLNSQDQVLRQMSMKLQELGCFDELALESMQKQAVELEREIQGTNELIQEVAELVEVQGKEIDRVEESVDTAVRETGKTGTELVTASKYQQSNCYIWLWIFGILILIGLGIGLFFSLKLTKEV